MEVPFLIRCGVTFQLAWRIKHHAFYGWVCLCAPACGDVFPVRPFMGSYKSAFKEG